MTSHPHPFFEFPEVRVVEASAGSGKTYALARRYIQLLLNSSLSEESLPFQNILAITFTNKAAFEMKARIMEFLKKMALQKLSQEEMEYILKPTAISSREASRLASRIMEKLIHHYNYFQVQTIDSFINTLLSGCAFKMGLTAHFRIHTNSLEYLEYCLAEVIDQAQADKNVYRLFTQFFNIFQNLLFLFIYLIRTKRTGFKTSTINVVLFE